MFLTYFVFLLLSISNAIAKPQLFTFKDGNVGVNFLGFNAQAGLGGLLTGNAAHGGLSASAGTPFGQRAAAGIGGRNGEGGTYGGAFAGATAGNGVSAGAGLGGNAATGGILGAEASAGGVTKNVIKTVGIVEGTSEIHNENPPAPIPEQPNTSVVQKIKPPKKYGVGHVEKRNQPAVAPIEYSKTKTTVLATPAQGSQVHSVSAEGQFNANGFFDGIFNIPISTLRAVNDFLNQGFGQSSVGVKKTVNVQSHY